jgi:hypothetical protein
MITLDTETKKKICSRQANGLGGDVSSKSARARLKLGAPRGGGHFWWLAPPTRADVFSQTSLILAISPRSGFFRAFFSFFNVLYANKGVLNKWRAWVRREPTRLAELVSYGL